MRAKIRRPTFVIALAVCLLVTASPGAATPPARAAADDEMSAEQIIAKHLEAVGAAAARSSIKNMVVLGSCAVTFQSGTSQGGTDGQIVIGSDENKTLIGMKFASPSYPQETFAYDGKRLTIGYVSPGKRSPLGGFLLTQESLFREGLVGGVLTTAWPLATLEARGAKLKAAGTEKVGGRKAYKLKYAPKKGSDMELTLFFDAETFQHVRTEYERVVPAGLGTRGVESSSSQRSSRIKIVEGFSDFKREEKLTLPHTYTLDLYIDTGSVTTSTKWTAKLTQFMFNQSLDPNTFNVEPSK